MSKDVASKPAFWSANFDILEVVAFVAGLGR